jgi:hypothetical protein
MANEIQASLGVTVTKNGESNTLSQSVTLTLAGNKIVSNAQFVGTSLETVLLGEITNPQLLCLVNLSTTDAVSVELGGVQVIHLLPSGTGLNFCFLPPETAIAYRMVGGGTGCNVLVLATEA